MAKTESKRQQPLVRVDAADKETLEELAAMEGVSTPRILHRVIQKYKRDMFFDRLNRGYQNMKEDPKLWAQEQADRKLFESSIGDGLSGLK